VEPVTAWGIRLGSAETEAKGTLALTDDHLSFQHAKGVRNIEIPLPAITKVKRSLGSPVLVVDYLEDGRPVRAAFFFAPPPPISRDPGTRKRREKRENMGTFIRQSASKGGNVKQWREEVRAAARRARTEGLNPADGRD